MKPCYHQTIDARLRRLVEVSVQKIDADPALVAQLAQNVARWPNPRLQAQWQRRLRQPWPALRAELLAETEQGAALRQDAPLGGILSGAERTRIMRPSRRSHALTLDRRRTLRGVCKSWPQGGVQPDAPDCAE